MAAQEPKMLQRVVGRMASGKVTVRHKMASQRVLTGILTYSRTMPHGGRVATVPQVGSAWSRAYPPCR